jgi:hypothetical protein
MAVSDAMTSTDWMLLALSSMGAQQKTLAQAYVSRTLAQGDIHTAASILLGLGDHNDAVEVYVSHKFYMCVAYSDTRTSNPVSLQCLLE